MTPYKGIIRITCTEKKCSPVTAGAAMAKSARRVGFTPTALTQPAAECLNCDRAKIEIIDLEGKVIAEGPEQGRRAKSTEQGAKSAKPATKKPLKGLTQNTEP